MSDNAIRELSAEMDRNILAGLRDALPAGPPMRVSVTEDAEAAAAAVQDNYPGSSSSVTSDEDEAAMSLRVARELRRA